MSSDLGGNLEWQTAWPGDILETGVKMFTIFPQISIVSVLILLSRFMTKLIAEWLRDGAHSKACTYSFSVLTFCLPWINKRLQSGQSIQVGFCTLCYSLDFGAQKEEALKSNTHYRNFALTNLYFSYLSLCYICIFKCIGLKVLYS